MTKLSKLLAQSALAALLGVGALAVTTSGASAYVVCNHEGDCWHTKDRVHYPLGFGIAIHPDNWAWHGDRYRWREHEGRGYWRGGVWITL